MSAERTSRAAAAAEQLCATLWEALADRLQAGAPQQAAPLAERIAEIARTVAELARIEPDGGGTHDGSGAGGEVRGGRGGESRREEGRGEPRESRGEAREGRGREGPGEEGRSEGREGRGGEGRSAEDRGEQAPARILNDAPALVVDEQSQALSASIEIRDARQSGEGTPWGTVVQRRLDRYLADRERFAILLVELLDAERLRLAQSPSDASRQIRDVEAAMVAQLRPADALVREADGRYWLIAPDTDAATARALAGAIAAAARRSACPHGAPLGVAIGIALCPDHGAEAASLLGHAEVDLYAAEAGGSVLSDPDGDTAG